MGMFCRKVCDRAFVCVCVFAEMNDGQDERIL